MVSRRGNYIKSPTDSDDSNKGFTLIELLVVIAIIAMLLAILMPALGKVKEKAASLVCLTNLRSMQLAAKLYNDDNDNKMFYYSGTGGFWIFRMEPYIGDIDEARYCPATKLDNSSGVTQSSRHAWSYNNGGVKNSGSYTINGWLYQHPGLFADWNELAYQSLEKVRDSANTPTFADCTWFDRWPRDTDTVAADHDLNEPDKVRSPSSPYDNSYSSMGLLMIDRHGKSSNVAFADGHAEAVDLSDFWTLKWNRQFKSIPNKQREDNGGKIYQK